MYDHHDGWEALANAIIISAIEDLRLACKGEGEAAEDLRDECVDFLLSRRAAQLTTADLRMVVSCVLNEQSNISQT